MGEHIDQLLDSLLGPEHRSWSEPDRWERFAEVRRECLEDIANPSPRVQRAAESRLRLVQSVEKARKAQPDVAALPDNPRIPSPSTERTASSTVPPVGITDLVSRYSPPYIFLQWEWPAALESVRVAWGWNHVPQNPTEPDILREDVTRSRYDALGCFRLRADLRRTHHFALFPIVDSALERFGPMSSIVEPTGAVTDVRYEVVVKRRFVFFGEPTGVFVRFRTPPVDGRGAILGGIAVYARPEVVATDPRSGSIIHDRPALSFNEEGIAEIDIPRQFWGPRLYARAFFTGSESSDNSRRYRLLPASAERLRLG